MIKIEENILKRVRKEYQVFKQAILTMMAEKDPLYILESGIFDHFEDKAFTPLYNAHQRKEFATMIKEENIEGFKFNIVERKVHSTDHFQTENRLRRMQEQSKVDLTIWSNIMNNHFSKQIHISVYNHPMASSNNDPSLVISENSEQLDQSELHQNSFYQIFEREKDNLWRNFTKKNAEKVMKQIYLKIEQETEKINEENRYLRIENQKLKKINQENSFKELESIVRQKSLEKRIFELQSQLNSLNEEMKSRQQFLREKQNKINRDFLHKLKEAQNLNKQNLKNNSLGEFWERVNLESVKRKTLFELDREKSKIDLQKESFGYSVPLERIDQEE